MTCIVFHVWFKIVLYTLFLQGSQTSQGSWKFKLHSISKKLYVKTANGIKQYIIFLYLDEIIVPF